VGDEGVGKEGMCCMGSWRNCGRSEQWEEEKFGARTKPLGMSSKDVPAESQQLGMCRWTDMSDGPVPIVIFVPESEKTLH
jgi:hypothetical protein